MKMQIRHLPSLLNSLLGALRCDFGLEPFCSIKSCLGYMTATDMHLEVVLPQLVRVSNFYNFERPTENRR
jgi:hypothetical protein